MSTIQQLTTPTFSQIDILPHLLLPFLLIGGYFLPPFRGRAAVFLALLTLIQWRCAVSSWPPNTGDTRAMRYGLATSWIFVLPVVERLVMHTPERDIWRVNEDEENDDEKSGPKNELKPNAVSTSLLTSTSTLKRGAPRTTVPDPNVTAEKLQARAPEGGTTMTNKPQIPEWSSAKLLFALHLIASPRAVGYNISGRSVTTARARLWKAQKTGVLTRTRFVTQKFLTSAVCYVVWDAIMVVWQRVAAVPDAWEWDSKTLREIGVAEVLMLGTVYCGMTMQFENAAGIAVGLGLSKIEDWPPAFGNILDCYTVANVWGTFWHQYIRQPCLGFSHYLIQALHIPRRSTLAYLVHLATAFFISALCHILAIGTVAPGFYSLRTLASDMFIFFMLQPVGALMEGIAITLFKRYIWTPDRTQRKDPVEQEQGARYLLIELPNRRRDELQGLIMALCRLAGYIWVICWFYVTSWGFIKAYAGVRMQDWQLPYSVVGRVLSYM